MRDTIDMLVCMLLALMRRGHCPRLWKRDVSRAFRKIAIAAEHLHLSWVTFMRAGVAWAAQHTAMPFGITTAVYGWHRVGAMLCAVVRRLFLAPTARFVDDLFGCSRDGVYWSGWRCLSTLAVAVGLACAHHEDADDLVDMIVLGARVTVQMERASVTVRSLLTRLPSTPRSSGRSSGLARVRQRLP